MNINWMQVGFEIIINDFFGNDIVWRVSIMTVSIFCKNLIPVNMGGIT